MYDPLPNQAPEPPLNTQTHQMASGGTYLLQQHPARRLINLCYVPVLLVTTEAGTHAGYDTFTVLFLRQAGVNVKHVPLTEAGIRGNGLLMFLGKKKN